MAQFDKIRQVSVNFVSEAFPEIIANKFYNRFVIENG